MKLAFQCAQCMPSNLGKIMFHLWRTFYFCKANITHLREAGDGKVIEKIKFFGSKGNGRTDAQPLYIRISFLDILYAPKHC